jgi:hypothetical protein
LTVRTLPWTKRKEMEAAARMVVRLRWKIGCRWWKRIDETKIPGCQGQ